MQGAIAAGHQESAKAGLKMLELGGNAFDAAAAAVFAGCVCEPTLTGLGGGGFATVFNGTTNSCDVYDFFVSNPGINLSHQTSPMQEVEIMYGQTPVPYNIGPASVGVPGLVKGILSMHEKNGILSRKQILLPAITLAKEGVLITKLTHYNLAFVEKIILNTQAGRDIFNVQDRLIFVGEKLIQTELCKTLSQISLHGEQAFYQGEIASLICKWSKEKGGFITQEDLNNYKVKIHQPISLSLQDCDIFLPPPPSSGGVLTAVALKLWGHLASNSLTFDSLEGIDLFLRIMGRVNNLRGREFDELLYEGGLVEKILNDENIHRITEQLKNEINSGTNDLATQIEPGGRAPNTTQVSSIDEKGNAVSITTSTGVGSGEFVANTGMQLSNMLGESDLFPTNYRLKPGQRLTSMMSPMLVVKGNKPYLATGSAGSTRIRTAIFQTLLRTISAVDNKDLQSQITRAINTGRIHQEGDVIHIEPNIANAETLIASLKSKGYFVELWDHPHLYFGGVNMVAFNQNEFAAQGDIRRAGVGQVLQDS